MKYSIQETNGKISPYKLYRYDEYAGIPNNAELEFWLRIQKLESSIKKFLGYTRAGVNANWQVPHRQIEELAGALEK